MCRTVIKVEPYWNVKLFLLSFLFRLCSIKVEPYWNVKVTMLPSALPAIELK